MAGGNGTPGSPPAGERRSGTADDPAGPHSATEPVSPTLGWLLAVGGAVGLYASLVLTQDKIRLLADPTYVPTCSINAILSCGRIIATDQASVFGFPNPLIGIGAFSVLIALGVLRCGRVLLPRWVLAGVVIGSTLGGLFVSWLAYQSILTIGALCPWCMVVWGMTVPILGLSLRDLLASGGPRLRPWQQACGWLVLLWFAVVLAGILVRFYL